MRKPTLLLLVAVLACDAADPGAPVLIPDFAERATRLACERTPLPVQTAPTEIRLADDSTWTLLDDPQRMVLAFDDRLRLRWRQELPAVGPGGVPQAVSVALLGDTALAVASRGGLRLVILSRDGAELDTAPLDFIPNSIAAAPDGAVLVTPVPYGMKPPTLLMRYERGLWQPLAVPHRHYTDMTVNALANSTLVEPLPGGSLLVLHQFLHPRAFRVGTAGQVEALVPPVPDDARDQVDYVPRSPITDDQVPLTALPAMAASVDPTTSDVLVLTRSGRMRDGRPERAVLRLDDRVRFLEGYLLPIPAMTMIYLPRRRALLVVDDEDGFHLCPIPAPAESSAPAE